MPAADELYLLSQKSSDLYENLIFQFQKHFDWLDEVINLAKESRGQAIIPKTPGRKKRNKKVADDIENEPPSLPPPPPPIENVRKSSRAAAKAAQEKTKKTIQQISNINSKIRRPSSPPQLKQDVPKSISSTKIGEMENLEIYELRDDVDIILPETPNSEVDGRIDDRNICEETSDKSTLGASADDEMHENIVNCVPNNNSILEDKQTNTCQDYVNYQFKEVLEKHEFSKPTRITRTKKRMAETADTVVSVQSEEIPLRNTRSKKRKVEENHQLEEVLKLKNAVYQDEKLNTNLPVKNDTSDSHPVLLNPSISIENEVSGSKSSINVPQRITRSKVQRLISKNSPNKENMECSPSKQSTPSKTGSSSTAHRTLKGKIDSPSLVKEYSPRNRFGNCKLNNFHTSKPTQVQEVSVESNDMSSSPIIVRHILNSNLKSGTSTLPRSKKLNQTPSPLSSASAKMLSLRTPIYGSAGLQSTYAQKRKPIICSSPQIGGKAISTPTEVSRVKNIMMGPSFLTKVLPNKPTKEETEEKKKEEMRRKREREEETRRKREEILKLQTEEKKRKNEERMRKVQESRELRQKKEAEAREIQEKEKKQREERLKEERRRKQLELRKIEELKLKKQAEEDRVKVEKRMREEQRLMEEQKIKEELRKLEEKRKFEEKKLQEKREAERLARERLEMQRIKEEQRIAREKEEIERLKMKEEERLRTEKQLNETYTANTEHPLNSTYNKPELNSTSQKSEDVQSYEITPVAEKKKPKRFDANDYGIGDLRSDDSTDDECAPKKKIPSWAQGTQLRKQLFEQEHFPPNIDVVFPSCILLRMPDLSQIFVKHRSRFTKRTSSAVWNTPPYKVLATNR